MEPEFKLKPLLLPSVCTLNSMLLILCISTCVSYHFKYTQTIYNFISAFLLPPLHYNLITPGKVSIIIILVLYNVTYSEDVIYLIILLQMDIWVISVVLIL